MDIFQPFLPPIEHPKNWVMKLVYALARKQFGRVVTPLKVVGPRVPLSFSLFGNKIYQLDKQMSLPADLTLLVRQLVARLNVCEFCMDASRFKAAQGVVAPEKMAALGDYAYSPVFSEGEKAAFDYATELTQTKNMRAETFEKLAHHFTERQVCEIVFLIATEHVSNLTNIGLNIHSDQLCDLEQKKATTFS